MNTRKIKLSVNQMAEMKHCVGGDYMAKGRNYFNTGVKEDSWEELVEMGIADSWERIGSQYYSLTEHGLEVLKRILI